MGPRHCWVYAFLEPVTHEVRYVGCAVDPYNRLQSHMGAHHVNNPMLADWIKGLRKRGVMPCVLILERTKHDLRRGERERFWVEKYHAEGADLFNKQLRPDWPSPNAGNLDPKSHAGKIRAALDKLGWDASARDVVEEVGPVIHYMKGKNCRWTGEYWELSKRPRPYLLPQSYVYQIRRLGPRAPKIADGT